MQRRWALARALMHERDLVALLVFGHSSVNRHHQANVFWLSNHLGLHHNYLLAPVRKGSSRRHRGHNRLPKWVMAVAQLSRRSLIESRWDRQRRGTLTHEGAALLNNRLRK
jgi:hypothetical protein